MAKEDDGASAEVYRRYLQNGESGFQRCDRCGAAAFYPRVLCPVCGSDARGGGQAGDGPVHPPPFGEEHGKRLLAIAPNYGAEILPPPEK